MNTLSDTGQTLFFPLKGMSRNESIFSDRQKGIFSSKYRPIFRPILNKQLAVNTYYQNDLVAPANARISIDLLKIFDELKINFKVNIRDMTVEERDHAFDAAISRIIALKKRFMDAISEKEKPQIQTTARSFIQKTLRSKTIPLFRDHFNEISGYLQFASDVITREDRYIGVAAALKQVVENEKQMFALPGGETGETIGHIIKTAWLSLILAKELGFLSEKDYQTLSVICIGHDGGKALMPQEIIYKQGRLSQLETDIMKSHVLFSYILASNNQQDLNFESFAMALHHVKENKTLAQSYSIARDTATSFSEYLTDDARKKLDQIYQYTRPFYRIISIADSFEAISAERVYKKASSIGKTLDIMIKCNQSQAFFYPPYLDALIRYVLKTFLPRNLKFNITDEILDTAPGLKPDTESRKKAIKTYYQGVLLEAGHRIDGLLKCVIYDRRNKKIEHRVTLPPMLFLNHMYLK